jgi:hypothetical protein
MIKSIENTIVIAAMVVLVLAAPAHVASAGTTRASSVSGCSLRAGNDTSSQSKRTDSRILWIKGKSDSSTELHLR